MGAQRRTAGPTKAGGDSDAPRSSEARFDPTTAVDVGQLRDALEGAMAEEGCSMQALTVLSHNRDPFRVDTPAGHRDGRWFAEQLEAVTTAQGLGDEPIHIRGVHYGIIKNLGEVIKPDGLPYTNTEQDWVWLLEKAAKRARWLGYAPFAKIVDQRNAEPVIKVRKLPFPNSWISVGLDVDLPDLNDLDPTVYLDDFLGTAALSDRAVR